MKSVMSGLAPEQQIAFLNILEEVSKNVGENGMPSDVGSNGMATQETKGQ